MSRKRPAPGADPVGYSQQLPQSAIGPQMTDDQFLQWGQSVQPPSSYQNAGMYSTTQPPSYPTASVPSNQLTRRPINQLATTLNTANTQWMAEPTSATLSVGDGGWEDDLEELEARAQTAKRDAQAKRKSIPPFVLKLRSFLDDGKNGDLIRWTDDGRSFVVLDEDEFAKKLIPELFKHNNYASFVRQLNMYGFHKKVGLSDNSMRASERKSKSPSEYSNPYFRQGYKDLMWLIQKPKNITSGSKGKARSKQDGENQNIDEIDDFPDEVNTDTRVRPRPQLTLGEDIGSGNLSQDVLQNVQRELAAIRHQQAQISKMMASIKHEHEQLYGQAKSFQDQHTRHENSINAILTFLATIYNRSLANNDGPPGIANIFNGSIPPTSSTGNVVDVGDYNFDSYPGMEDVNKPFKKQTLLLTDGQNRAQTMSPGSAAASPFMRSSARRPSQAPRASQSPNTHQIEELHDNLPTATQAGNRRNNDRAGNQSQQDMMSMIQSANARNPSPTTPVNDFTHVLNDLENSRGNTPLSSTQRENVLRMINNSANGTGDNALVNTTPPSGPANFDRRLASTTADLDALARMQAQQDQSVEKLTNLLQPLSPSGSIPGIGDGQSLPPPPMDIDDFLNHNEYFATDLPSDGNGNFDFSANGVLGDNEFNWDDVKNEDDDEELFEGVGNNQTGDFLSVNPVPANGASGNSRGHSRIESVASSEAATPKAPSDTGGEESNGRGTGFGLRASEDNEAKRRRRS